LMFYRRAPVSAHRMRGDDVEPQPWIYRSLVALRTAAA
jgi:hypothetical protein